MWKLCIVWDFEIDLVKVNESYGMGYGVHQIIMRVNIAYWLVVQLFLGFSTSSLIEKLNY